MRRTKLTPSTRYYRYIYLLFETSVFTPFAAFAGAALAIVGAHGAASTFAAVEGAGLGGAASGCGRAVSTFTPVPLPLLFGLLLLGLFGSGLARFSPVFFPDSGSTLVFGGGVSVSTQSSEAVRLSVKVVEPLNDLRHRDARYKTIYYVHVYIYIYV